MSVRFGIIYYSKLSAELFNQFNKVVKQRCCIVWTWACFWVALEAKRWLVGTMNPFAVNHQTAICGLHAGCQAESLHRLQNRGFAR